MFLRKLVPELKKISNFASNGTSSKTTTITPNTKNHFMHFQKAWHILLSSSLYLRSCPSSFLRIEKKANYLLYLFLFSISFKNLTDCMIYYNINISLVVGPTITNTNDI